MDERAALDTAHLRYFHAVARHGSFTAGARALKVSQPTLTVAIKNLEERLHTTLFHRSRDGVKLTTTGDELLEHAAQVFALLDRAEARIAGLESDERGRFVIGCHESLGAYFLPTFLRGWLETAPGIEVSLWNGTSAAVTQAVLDREVDFGLVVNPKPLPELVLVQLCRDAVDVMVSAATLPGGRPLSREAAHARLREGPLVFAGRVGQATDLIERLAAESLLPARRLSCGDLELVKSIALEGVGVALLPRRVADYGQPGRLVRLHPELPFIPDIISLVYRADMHRTRATLRLKDALTAHGRSVESQPDTRPHATAGHVERRAAT